MGVCRSCDCLLWDGVWGVEVKIGQTKCEGGAEWYNYYGCGKTQKKKQNLYASAHP